MLEKGPNARSVIGDDKRTADGQQSTHDHGVKFTNAGAAGDKMVMDKFNSLPSCNYTAPTMFKGV